MLDLNLLDEVIDTSLKHKVISKPFLIKVLGTEIEKCSQYTKDHFKGINFKKMDNLYGLYIPKGKININYDLLCENDFDAINEDNYFLQKNIFMLYAMLHELEHFKEIEKIKMKKKYESELLNYFHKEFIYNKKVEKDLNESMIKKFFLDNTKIYENIYIKKIKLLTEKLYILDLREKIADFDSLKSINTALYNHANFKEKYFNSFDFFAKYFYTLILNGYVCEKDKINFPLFDFLNNLDAVDRLTKLDFWDKKNNNLDFNKLEKIDLYDRLKYNFPISVEEYKLVKNFTK